ncbi:MAG: hypothetical protein NC090_00830 [Anaeroplasma bactoclasticum]|nr:hypothetical protein [Anaeroplasma bactoclasticum]
MFVLWWSSRKRICTTQCFINRSGICNRNGSYILPNGVIVLVDEDIETYRLGNLEFHKKDNRLLTE